MANTSGRQQAEGQTKVNREEARMLVAAIGYEQASAKTGIKAATLRQWAKRFQWHKPMIHAQSKAVTTVTKPSDALATVLEERKDKSKLHLSKYVEDASRNASETNGNLKLAPRVKDVAAIHQAIWPEKEQQGSGVMPGLQVYSEQTVIQVQGTASVDATGP